MWRLFRWLDTHPPGFHKFSLMVFGLGMTVAAAFLLGRWHPAAGIVAGFGTIFGLWWSSMRYRFKIKPRLREEAGLPPPPPDPARLARRRERTERLRRHILWLAEHDRGKLGDNARTIKKRWDEAEAARAETPDKPDT
jgi:hypothetical protein